MPYIPKDSVPSSRPIERIALIGPPGSGKTTSLLSFPNLFVFDRDRKLPPGVISVPAWSSDWADSICKRTFKEVPNFRDAIKKWLRENHNLFEPEQTFAIDSWTFVQEACDLQTHAEDDVTPLSKSGEKNNFWFWGQKLRYSKELMDFIKAMKCRVVVTFHETVDRNEQGMLTGKIRPAQDGSYKDIILGNFTDVWRMRSNLPVTNAAGISQRNPDGSRKIDTGFFWQLSGDSVVDLNTNPLLGRIVRKHNLSKVEIKLEGDKVTGGYQTIQDYYAKECNIP